MSTKWQGVLSVALVVVAGGVVGVYGYFGDDGARAQDKEGHAHGVGPAAGRELQPVRLDAERARRIGVTYATAELKALERVVRTVASVTYDETRVTYVSPRIHGWVERIHVDFLGAPVERGQPLLELYSPELVTVQEELLLARGLLASTRDEPDSRAYGNAVRLLESARRRLDYWDIPADQVALVEETGRAQRTLLLRAPSAGIVVEKNVFGGAHVSAGSTLYAIADLSRVWVEGEVFEKDLSLLRRGQLAHVRVEAYPGETFHGSVGYIYPTVSVSSRTGRVRIQLENPGGRLKPGMYAEVQLDVPAGALAVVVPRTAVISTGERDVVFVRAADGMLVPREVTLGLPAGREIAVVAGLAAGEVVVSSASFLIDAESNLGAAMEFLGAGADGRTDGPEVVPPATSHERHETAPAGPGTAGHESHDPN